MIVKWRRIDELDNQQMNRIEKQLPSFKQKQINRMSHQAKQRTLTAWSLFMEILRELEIEYEPETIYCTANGKPYALNCSYYFSIAHCDEIAVCAVSEYEIGVDIERIRPVDLKHAKKFASPKEIEFMLEKESTYRFWLIWCMKEAIVKLKDLTLSEMPNIQFKIDDTNPISEDVMIETINILDDFLITMAHDKRDLP